MNIDNEVYVNDIIHLRVPGVHQYISVVRETVDAVSEQLRFPPDSRAAVKLAVGEACNNAVEHAAGSEGRDTPRTRPVPPVDVCMRVDSDALEIEIINKGNGFHPSSGATMPMPEKFAESGRGMALMEMLMDSVEYLSRNGNTVVRMRKRLPS